MQLQQMENRLNKLEEEEMRAKNLIAQNKKRCKEVDQMRRQKQQERDEKQAWRNWQISELKKKKKQVNYERAQLTEGI